MSLPPLEEQFIGFNYAVAEDDARELDFQYGHKCISIPAFSVGEECVSCRCAAGRVLYIMTCSNGAQMISIMVFVL